MRGPDAGDLSPDDTARLQRWQTAGQPPVPLVIDSEGIVHATTTSLATVLGNHSPRWAAFRRTAVDWVDAHCGA